MSYWYFHQMAVLGFVVLLIIIALTNFAAVRRLGSERYQHRLDSTGTVRKVSILVPARNEQANIEACVTSLLNQEYVEFEVIVLNDQSTDQTPHILARLNREFPNLRVLNGQALPAGWIGKHWACHQLAKNASSEVLLFTDADTIHHPAMLRDAMQAFEDIQADLLTALPHQQVATLAEKLTVPIIPFSILALLPLPLAHHLRLPALSSTIGQFMLFRRSAYDHIDGHAAIRANIVDDIALGRRIKAAGLRWRMVDGIDRVQTRMYRSPTEVVEGLSKNLHAVFGHPAIHSFIWLWMIVAFIQPISLLILSAAKLAPAYTSSVIAAATIGTSLLLWLLIYARARFPLWLALLYPLTILTIAFIAFRSLILTLSGRTSWKGRMLIREQGT